MKKRNAELQTRKLIRKQNIIVIQIRNFIIKDIWASLKFWEKEKEIRV